MILERQFRKWPEIICLNCWLPEVSKIYNVGEDHRSSASNCSAGHQQPATSRVHHRYQPFSIWDQLLWSHQFCISQSTQSSNTMSANLIWTEQKVEIIVHKSSQQTRLSDVSSYEPKFDDKIPISPPPLFLFFCHSNCQLWNRCQWRPVFARYQSENNVCLNRRAGFTAPIQTVACYRSCSAFFALWFTPWSLGAMMRLDADENGEKSKKCS